jgi:hypothetical protein
MNPVTGDSASEARVKADIEELRRILEDSLRERDTCGRIIYATLPICEDHRRAQARMTELDMIGFKARVALSNAWATLRKVQGRTPSELFARYATAPGD